MGRAGELVFERFGHVVAVAVGSVLLSAGLLYGLLAVGALHNQLWAAVGIESYTDPAGLLAMMILSWAATLLMQTPLVGSAIEIHTNQRGLFSLFLGRGLAKIPQIIAAAIALVLISLAVLSLVFAMLMGVMAVGNAIPWSFVGFIVKAVAGGMVLYGGLRVMVAFSLVAPVLVVEQLGVVDALRRSWSIGWRNAHAIFWAVLIPMLVLQAVLFLASFMPWYILYGVAIVGVGLQSLYNASVVPVAYVAIREFVDGLHPMKLVGRSPR